MEIVKLGIEDKSVFEVRDYKRQLLKNIPSHTLFSALINNMSLFLDKDEVDEYIKKFQDIKMSSILMGLEVDKENIYLLPKPKMLILPYKKDDLLEDTYDPSYQKEIKKIEYLSISLLKELGKTWDEDDKCFYFNLKAEGKQIGRDILVKKDDLPESLQNQNLENLKFRDSKTDKKTKVDRWEIEDSGKLHNNQRIIYSYRNVDNIEIKPFLYFFINGALDDNIKSAINLLKVEGLGAKRSLGYGQVKDIEYIEGKEEEHLLGGNGKIYMSISSFIPREEELDSLLSFDMAKVNGYMYLNGGLGYRKKTMGIIREGPLLNKDIGGGNHDVTPKDLKNLDYEITLYGKSLNIGLGDSYE